MGKYHVLTKVSKPYLLNNGDVVVAQPRKLLVILDECDSSDSIQRGCRTNLLRKIENQPELVIEEQEKTVASSPEPVTDVAADVPVTDVVADEEEPVENLDSGESGNEVKTTKKKKRRNW